MDKKNMYSDLSKTDILLYIALSEEFNDLSDMLIKELGDSFKPQEVNDISITIFCGTVFSPVLNKNIQIAIVPAGKMGITRAASVTSAILSKSRKCDVVVLGIAGALSNDLQPGDVFIPDSVNEYIANSATKGKVKKWTFETSGNHLPTSPRLLNRFQMFRNTQKALFEKWSNDCAARFSPLIKGKIQKSLTKAGFDIRSEIKLLVGDDRKLASGPAVGKGNAFVQWIKEEVDRKVAAMEMESAGVYDAVHIRTPALRAIAIRGISDFADERKELIESVAKDQFRSVSVQNALSLLLCSIEAGLFINEEYQNSIFEPKVSAIDNKADKSKLNLDKANDHSLKQIEKTNEEERSGDKVTTNSKLIIRECLKKSFSNIDDIKNFCFDYFDDVYREISKEDGYSAIITKVVQYCYAHDCMENLWDGLKIERLNHYNTYYSMWEQTVK